MTTIIAASQGAVLTVWGVSLIIGLVVLIVVGVLLHLIRRTAIDIEGGAAAIWTQGKLVANNTIQIPLFLSTTNKAAGSILDTAVDILGAAKGIENHAEGCPGCPACVLSQNN